MSNLLLWFPWSLSPVLGMTLMLTVSPVIWFYASFSCLRTYPKVKPLDASVYNALFFLTLSVVMDYVFFGLIRNAMTELYHPTTFYAYGFVVSLPFIILIIFKKQLRKSPKIIYKQDFYKTGLIGSVCLLLLSLIIFFDVQI
jgi:hypothetical protein